MHHVFQWRRLQRLVVPQERYGERSEPALKRKRLSQPRKESEPLGAPTRRSPSIVSRSGSVSSLSFAVRDAFSYAGVRFHSPTLSNALEMIVGTSQETQESWKKTPPLFKRSRSTEVNGAVHGPWTGKGALCGCVARK